jgi:putative hydrolase of the HAD superfamily
MSNGCNAMIPYKAILLDFDNTFYSYEPCHKSALSSSLEYLAKYTSRKPQELVELYLKARDSVGKHLNGTAASHSRILYFQKMCQFLQINALGLPLELEEIYWSTFLKKIELLPDSIRFLEFLKSQHVKTAIVTDLTTPIQHKKILYLGLASYFDFIVTSEEAGRDKPDPTIFRLALEKLKLQAHDVCMVGDNYDKDIEGAYRLGIDCFWLTNETSSEMGVCFSTFSELMSKMGSQRNCLIRNEKKDKYLKKVI